MSNKSEKLYIGLMSGTSIDAIDAAVISIDNYQINVVASHTHAIPENIKTDIVNLCQPSENEIARMGKLDFELGHLFAEASLALLKTANLKASQITAIGSHGQTIRHIPDGNHPFTLQISNPALISQLTGVTTVADFRRADMAAGGQGAPLVPAFHHALFYDDAVNRVILNIGGMANISILKKFDDISGFDTGPGNILLNEWIQKTKKQPYDRDGEWSANHNYSSNLLEAMKNDHYFSRPAPKSTGREYFNLDWIKHKIYNLDEQSGTVQSTLCELTAQTIIDAIKEYAENCEQILICGGGIHNKDLMNRLHQYSNIEIISTSRIGIDPDFVEAAAFAWFAHQTLQGKPSNAPAVTGAKYPVILGAIHPASLPQR